MPRFWTRLVDSLPRESKSLVWRAPLVVAVVLVSLFVFVPFQDTPYAVWVVRDTYAVKGDREELDLSARQVLSKEVTNRLVWLTSPFHYWRERELSAKELTPVAGRRVRERRLEILSSGLNLGLDLRGGTELRYRILQDTSSKEGATAEEIKEVIQKRVDAYGLREPRIQAQGSNRILIQLPGQASAFLETIKGIIENIGHLEFRLVADPESAAATEWKKSGMAQDPPGYTTYAMRALDESQGRYEERKVLVSDRVDMTGEYIRATRVIQAGSGRSLRPSVGLSFTPVGEQQFASVTGDNVGQRLAIILNTRRAADGNITDKGLCYSAPSIRTKIYGDAVIEGDFSMKECTALRTVLMAGSLPAPLALEHENTVGPSLGPVLISKGFRAIAIGLAAVVVFMMLYYWFAGAVANFALLLNLLIIVSIMILFDATLTLPGIAGLLLTVGMSVDANVLIFERVREEKGSAGDRPLRLAIRDGYGRAFWTIFDANLTTLFTAIILYWRGTGAIKGFAIVLTIGILASMFTALVCTRVVFDLLTWRRWLTRLPMAQLIKKPSIAFMRLRNRFLLGSLGLIVLGMAVFVARWEKNWDIDFRGGTLLHVVFAKPMDADELTRRLRGDPTSGKEFERVEVQSLAAAAQEGTTPFVGRRATEFVIRFPYLSEATIQPVTVTPAAGPGNLKARVALHQPMARADVELALKAAKVFGYIVAPVGQPAADGKAASFDITAPLIDAAAIRAELEKALAPYKPADQESAFASFEPGEPTINIRATTGVGFDRPILVAAIQRELNAAGGYWEVEAKEGKTADGKATSFVIRSSLGSAPEVRFRIERAFATQGLTTTVKRIFGKELVPDDVQTLRTADGKATVAVNLTKRVPPATLEGKLKDWGIEATLQPPPEGADGRRIVLQLAADRVAQLTTHLRKETDTFPLSNPIPRVAKVGPAVAFEMLIWAVVAIAAASVIIIAYVWLRFERFKYGIAAVAALIHDVLITMGILAIFQRNFNLPIVAALLTIIGYSINDTIVVFDRIRENLRRERKRDVDASIIDASVNQVLGRTLLTSITTLLAVLSLFLFAGGVIQDFALALLVGVVVGTYSSIFIASPLLILHQEQIEKRLKRA